MSINSLSATGAASVVLGTDSLTINEPTSSSFAGVLSGAGQIIYAGASTLTLSGANTYTGGTILNSGTLAATNSSALGVGSHLSVTGGTLAIGSPTAVVSVASGAASFTGGTLSFALNGTAVGSGGSTGYAQLSVTGNVSLGSATTLAYTSTAFSVTGASVLTIVTCTGTLTGTFANAANGSVVTVGGNAFSVAYTTTSVKLIPIIYVDATWTGASNGTPETVAGQSVTIGSNAFATITAGLGAAASGAYLEISANTYAEAVTITSPATLNFLPSFENAAVTATSINSLSSSLAGRATTVAARYGHLDHRSGAERRRICRSDFWRRPNRLRRGKHLDVERR